MSWRVVEITGVAKLDLKMGFLVVRKERTTKIHISELHTLIIDSTMVSMTTALLNELLRQKVKIIFCDEAHNPSGEVLPSHGSHDSSMKIKLQIGWSEEIKRDVWTEIVTEKIRKQRDLLRLQQHTEAADLLECYLTQLQPGDATNREGHAAKVYFDALFGMDFTRGAECVTNAALNYGYSILLSVFNREISANGYLTQLGLFHDNRFNPFNLACDLMEPFRPLVDRIVVESGFEAFGQEEKLALVHVLNQHVRIASSNQRLTNAVKRYSKSVFDALNHQDISELRFYSHELSVYESDRLF